MSPVRTPPSPWALEVGLHEVAMRTLDLARTDGWIQRKCAGVVQLVESVGEIALVFNCIG